MPLLLFGLLSALPSISETRAIAFLSREIPAWSPANKCFSCHNNGNGVRGLLAAGRGGYRIPDRALADSLHWLAKPSTWDRNGGDQAFNDRALSELQFALALHDAIAAGRVRDRKPLTDVAARVAARQRPDGSWAVGSEDPPGSATTFGPTLATAEARQLLVDADAAKFRAAIERANRWIRQRPVKTVLDAAAVLLALGIDDDAAADRQRKACLEVLARGASSDGGWGPYVKSSSEAFDTALVVLALARQPPTDAIRARVRSGREYLLRTQQPDGSWIESTRPTAGISYAERISTTSWALRALLDSDARVQRRGSGRTSKGT